jgi:peptidoglycan/xylan/chitin deacetylase (PgdA/CDA1 family)
MISAAMVGWCSCTNVSGNASVTEPATEVETSAPAQETQVVHTTPKLDSSAVSILNKKQVPILCYHQIRPYKPNDSPTAKAYIVPPDMFKDQMKALHDSGYQTILPDQLRNYLLSGESLPDKAVLISFDDGCDEQYEITKEVLDPYKMKAAYFIMTVAINRPNYMKAEQIKALSEAGHSIGLHTWDHNNVKKYQGEDWLKQIEKPKATLEKITGKPVEHFAYPFGLWNPEAIPHLKEKGLKTAFILSTTRDEQDPLFTIRRIIVPGTWTGTQLLTRMKSSF